MSRSRRPLAVTLHDVGLRPLAAAVAAVVVVALIGAPQTTSGPFGGVVVPWSVLSCVAPLLLAGVWRSPMGAFERASARGPAPGVAARVGVGLVGVAVATAVVSVAAPADASPVSGAGLAAWRNAALLCGIVLPCAAWLPAAVAWLPGTSYVLAVTAAGVDDVGPRAWALPVQPAQDGTALAVSLAVLGVGAAIAALRLRR